MSTHDRCRHSAGNSERANSCGTRSSGVEISPTTTLPITGVTEATDGNYNFKSFEVEVSAAGSYYTEFWLLPTKYANNRYSTFFIYVNENYIGTINPTIGNWQAVRVDAYT